MAFNYFVNKYADTGNKIWCLTIVLWYKNALFKYYVPHFVLFLFFIRKSIIYLKKKHIPQLLGYLENTKREK